MEMLSGTLRSEVYDVCFDELSSKTAFAPHRSATATAEVPAVVSRGVTVAIAIDATQYGAICCTVLFCFCINAGVATV